jgi:hypothetical protein
LGESAGPPADHPGLNDDRAAETPGAKHSKPRSGSIIEATSSPRGGVPWVIDAKQPNYVKGISQSNAASFFGFMVARNHLQIVLLVRKLLQR